MMGGCYDVAESVSEHGRLCICWLMRGKLEGGCWLAGCSERSGLDNEFRRTGRPRLDDDVKHIPPASFGLNLPVARGCFKWLEGPFVHAVDRAED